MGSDSIRIGGLTIDYLRDGAADRTLGNFELTVQPGANVPPPHSHRDNEEMVYVLEGTLRYTVDGVVRDLGPGEWMHTPRGSVHGFSNPHDKAVKALVTLSPDIGAQYFRDIAQVAGAGGPPDKAKLVAVMQRYGLTPAAPPPAHP